MPVKNEPNLNLNYGWDEGESGISHQLDENWRTLGALVQLSFKSSSLTAPPASPVEGDRYIVSPGSTGGWLGRDNQVARFIGGIWEFYTPEEGWCGIDTSTGLLLAFSNGSWTSGVQGVASEVGYDPVGTGLSSNDVQSALTELAGLASPSGDDRVLTDFAYKESLSPGLQFTYSGGLIKTGNESVTIPDGVLSLTPSATNYVYVHPDAGVDISLSRPDDERTVVLYVVETDDAVKLSVSDERSWMRVPGMNWGLPKQKPISTPVYTLQPQDANKIIRSVGGTITLTDSLEDQFQDGTMVVVRQEGFDQVDFSGSGVFIAAGESLKTRTQGSVVTLIKLAHKYWMLAGDLELSAATHQHLNQDIIDTVTSNVQEQTGSAEGVSYNNTGSGLTATNAQEAIDELAAQPEGGVTSVDGNTGAVDLSGSYEVKRQNNLNATTDPTATDDSAAGYEPLSRWVNTTTGEFFVCVSATNGAANWQKASLTLDELGSAALVNTGTGGAEVPRNSDLGSAAFTDTSTYATATQGGKADSALQPVPGKQLSDENYTSAEKSKLSGVANNATQNSTDAQLRDRSTHTGTQSVSTITGLSDAATTSVSDIRSGTSKADVGLGNVRDVPAYSQSESDDRYEPRRSSNLLWDSVSDTFSRDSFTTGVTPIHERMRRCVMNDAGDVVYYLDPNDSAKKADGTPADITGTDGQVMVEIPKFYVRIHQLFNGDWKREISEYPRSGFVVHPAFAVGGTLQYDSTVGLWHYVGNTGEREATYVGAYQASVYSDSGAAYIDGLNLDNNDSWVSTSVDKLASVSGKYPMVGLTRDQFRTLAANRGGVWSQWSFWQLQAVKLLFFIEYGTFDGQTALTQGNVNVSSGYPSSSSNQTDSPHSVSGKSDSIGNTSGGVGSSNRDTAWLSYRGIENLWGNAWQWCDGWNIYDHQFHICNDPGLFADNTTTNYTPLGNPVPASNGYIRNVQHETLGDVISDVSGNSSTAFCDYMYQNPGWRVAPVGGLATYGSFAGPSCVYVINSSGSRNRGIAGRLARI